MNRAYDAIAIMGATATGKSELAIVLAEEIGGEIISMDSRQVYRGFDIGTGKVTPGQQRRVPHHLIDNLDPWETNSAGAHVRRAEEACRGIRSRGKIPFFVGGTGLYFRVLFEGLIDAHISPNDQEEFRNEHADRSTADLYDELARHDAKRAAVLSPKDRVRILRALEVFHRTGKTYSQHLADHEPLPAWTGLKIVLTMPRAVLREHIARRTREMYRNGWANEVHHLIAEGIAHDAPAMNSLGYDVIAAAVRRGDDPGDTTDPVITLTQQYAKRQETFWRSVPDAHWIDVSLPDATARARGLVRAHLGL
jgi:tRNA dimethylallyltransferase